MQPAAFGYQPQIIRPGGAQIPNYIGYPNVPLRQGQQGQRAGGRRGGAPQQQQQQQPQQQVYIIFSSLALVESVRVIWFLKMDLFHVRS